MRKFPFSIITTFFKISAAFFLVIFIVELLEIYLTDDKSSSLNSHGFWDKEYPYKKPDNVFRILVLGDSQTLGQGIKNLDDTWHKQLETLMNKGFKRPKFEIISLAGGGWNTDTQLYELFKSGYRYNPNLILIGFNHNDVPVPHASECQDRTVKFFPHSKFVKWLRKKSKVYQLFEFRLNHLLEKFEQKPEYADCINRRFKSRGWDMEKVYLDTIFMSGQIKNTHLMLATLPLLHKLGDDYPFKKANLKIKKYCADKKITYSDIYLDGFQGLSSTSLRVSITDRHLNETGTAIVAQTLFKKLKALRTYKHLPAFSGAFELNELLDQKNLIVELDKKFSQVKKQGNSIELNSDNNKLKVKNQNNLVEYSNIVLDRTSSKTIKVVLDLNGNFQESEITFQKSKDPNINFLNNKHQNGIHHLISGTKTQNGNFLRKTEKIFLGNYISTNASTKIRLFPNLEFMDPKSLEIAFSETEKPKAKFSSLEAFNAVSKFIKLNPHLFFDFKNKGYTLKNKFNKLSRLKQILIYREMEWTKYFFTLSRLGHKPYMDSLIKDILKHNPVPVLLRSIERYYFLNKNREKLSQLYQSNPNMPNRFKT